jgi:TRAP-type C4-dicarboxylate transport system permease large subunit
MLLLAFIGGLLAGVLLTFLLIAVGMTIARAPKLGDVDQREREQRAREQTERVVAAITGTRGGNA